MSWLIALRSRPQLAGLHPRPFAIVGGLIGRASHKCILLATLDVWIARPSDILPVPETEFEN
jgi:hypothetical protein